MSLQRSLTIRSTELTLCYLGIRQHSRRHGQRRHNIRGRWLTLTDESRSESVIEPHIIECRCGGWLAVSPMGVPFRFGVTARSELEAKERFYQSLARWEAALDTDQVAVPTSERPAAANGEGGH